MTAPARPAGPLPFDPRPLTDPIDPAGLAATPKPGGLTTAARIYAVVMLVGGAAMFVSLVVQGLVSVVLTGGTPSGAAVLGPLLVLAVLGGGAALWVVEQRRARRRRYVLERFARANGMAYVPRVEDPALPGMIFGRGSGRAASDLVRSAHAGRFVEFGNYRYTTGSGKNKHTHEWGYVAIRLDTPLPHIVLDALGNNSFLGSNLPTGFSRDQRLGLEGDFDRHFALYCPSGYEHDALYLFTPDVMARFIDHAAQLDVEIVDDWMLLYTQRKVSTTDPATWAWLISVVNALLEKIARWQRWRDERLAAPQAQLRAAMDAGSPAAAGAAPAPVPLPLVTPPPGVARAGRRLRTGVKWVPVIVVAVFVAFWMLPHLLGVLTMFLD